MAITNLTDQLLRDEGEILHAYQDSLGYWTIGVGHLIDRSKGGAIPEAISRQLLDHDIQQAQAELTTAFPWTSSLDEVRRGALVNMAFNLGIHGVSEFSHMLAALEAGDFEGAANDILASEWAKQVTSRAYRIASQIRTGEWQ